MKKIYIVIGFEKEDDLGFGKSVKRIIPCEDKEVADNIALDMEEEGLSVDTWCKYVISTMEQYQQWET